MILICKAKCWSDKTWFTSSSQLQKELSKQTGIKEKEIKIQTIRQLKKIDSHNEFNFLEI